ncbi:MAG: hypothetical protein IJ325_05830 [Clostridia bacterium]|nr:hypothetical protein [Clostridia bacterium]
MIDFHTHLLPCMDDGSKSVDESLAMLEALRGQGVTKAAATPHFYANDESVDDFIARRDASFGMLKARLPDTSWILPGAEVRYYEGISRLPDLKKLRIVNTRFVLLEMPFSQWTEYSVREIMDIAAQGKITPVLAHIDRYLPMLKKTVLPRLLNSGVLIQANVSFFTGFFTRSQALHMVRTNQIHFIGSDCHNLTDRPPDISKAISRMEKKFGDTFVPDYINYVNEIFQQNQIL